MYKSTKLLKECGLMYNYITACRGTKECKKVKLG